MSFGDNAPISPSTDMPLTRDAELTADVPVDDVAGAPGDLVFRLVSRRSQNAAVTIHGFAAVMAEDVDRDGLTNAAEVALSTNPMKADTDGDGSPDGAELAAGTDSKNPASRLANTSAAFAPSGFTLQWPAQTSRKYRVLRSATPGFESYENIGLSLPGMSPVQSFIDPAVPPGQAAGMFYKIQLEPQP